MSNRISLGPVDRLRHELRYAWSTLRSRRIEKSKEKQLRFWLKKLDRSPPEVLLGANIDVNGGVRQHLLGIQKYSQLNVELAPPDWLRSGVTYHDFHTAMRAAFFDYRPDGIRVLHSHVFPYFIEWCAKHRNSSTRWIHTYHAPYLPEYGRDGLEPWQVEINRVLLEVAVGADVRVSVSRWQQSYLLAEHGIEATYIPNGVDVELCDHGSRERFVAAAKLDKFILYVGRNDPVKNPADFVRLAGMLPQYTFAMIGPGLSAPSMLSDWSVRSPTNLHFLGELPRSQVQDAIAACNALVVTSKREGMPTLVLEAMTHRKSVVIPQDPGCLEATDNGTHGFVFAHGQLDDLATKTLAAINDPRDGDSARAHVLANFDWRVVAPQLDALYNGVGT